VEGNLERALSEGDIATSSQDAQKQMQGQPTAAQQAEGAKPSAQKADNDCCTPIRPGPRVTATADRMVRTKFRFR
jgi:hypothetical protein